MPKYTDLTIQKLGPGLHLDERTPSFGIRIGKHRKTWLVIRGANRTKETVGHYPELSLADARLKAKRLLVEVPTEKAPRISFAEAKEEFLREHFKDSTSAWPYVVKLIRKNTSTRSTTGNLPTSQIGTSKNCSTPFQRSLRDCTRFVLCALF